MNKIADALTFFRLLSAPVLFALLLSGQWQIAMVLFIAAILSDAFDGLAARRWPPEYHGYRKDPHAFDNAADGALSVLGVAGLLGRFFLAWLNDWSEAYLFVGWAAATTLILLMTGVFLFLVGQLVPASAEKVDVAHGFFYGLLLLGTLVQITVLATSPHSTMWLVLIAIATVLVCVVKWDRLTSRPEVTYTGTKTWGTLFLSR